MNDQAQKRKQGWAGRLLIGLFFFLPFFPALNISSGTDLSSLRVVLLGGGIVWAFGALARGRVLVPLTPPVLVISTLFLFAGISAFWADEPLFAVRKAALFFSIFPVVFLVAAHIRLHERILCAFAGGAAVSALFGLVLFVLQFFLGGQRIAEYIVQLAPTFFGSSVAETVALFPSWFVGVGTGQPLLRAFFPFPNPHTAALLWGMGLAVSFAGSKWQTPLPSPAAQAVGGQVAKSRRASRYTLYAIRYTLLAALLTTFSRGAYIALAVLLIAYGVRQINVNRARTLRYALCAGGVLVLGPLFFAPAFSERIAQTFNMREGSSAARLALWRGAGDIFREHPLIGAGLGNYAAVTNPLASYRTPTNAHSTYLEVAAELGIIGFSLLVFALGSALRFAQRFAEGGSRHHAAVFLALIFFSVHAVFETDLYSPANLTAFLALLTIAGLPPEKTNLQRRFPMSNED